MLDAKESLISPRLARELMAKLALKFGPWEDLDLWAEMHPSQIIEWENCGIRVSVIDPVRFDEKGMLHRKFMGLPLESNPHLSPSVVLIRKNREIVAEIGRLALHKWDVEEVNG
jgi:hypothetical protein